MEELKSDLGILELQAKVRSWSQKWDQLRIFAEVVDLQSDVGTETGFVYNIFVSCRIR